MAKHIPLPLNADHFTRWLDLFYSTIDQHFEGTKAEEARQRAAIMARTIYAQIQATAAHQGRVV